MAAKETSTLPALLPKTMIFVKLFSNKNIKT